MYAYIHIYIYVDTKLYTHTHIYISLGTNNCIYLLKKKGHMFANLFMLACIFRKEVDKKRSVETDLAARPWNVQATRLTTIHRVPCMYIAKSFFRPRRAG